MSKAFYFAGALFYQRTSNVTEIRAVRESLQVHQWMGASAGTKK